jgi:hypothetical protein
MAEKKSSAQRDNAAVETADVPDHVVVQVGKAVVEIMKLRQTFEEEIAAARSEAAAQDLANEVETAAVRAISDQGLTVDQYNSVISAAEEDSDLGERVLSACRAA